MTTTISRLAKALPDLNTSESRVAMAILDNPTTVVHQSITELAEDASTSLSTVVRLCQRLGFSGFQSLKIALAQESRQWDNGQQAVLLNGSGAADVFAYLASQTPSLLIDALSTIDHGTFAHVVERVSTAHRVLLVGAGSSSAVVQDAAYRLRLLGIGIDAPSDAHAQHVAARVLGSEDVCLGVSHTGATRETVAALAAARAAGAYRIVITSFGRSPLASEANTVLVAGLRRSAGDLDSGDSGPVLPTVSRLSHLIVIDALVAALARRDPSLVRRADLVNREVISTHLV